MELDRNFYNLILAIINNNLSIEKDKYGYYIKGKEECAKYLYDTVKQAVENILRFLDSAILKETITEKYSIEEPFRVPLMRQEYDVFKSLKPADIMDPSELYVIGNVKINETEA